MNQDKIFELYIKEREYQKEIFGDFKDNPTLNLASFLILVDKYLKKATNSYLDKWHSNLPDWLLSCKECEQQNTAPVTSYEDLIKVFALAGAALETFTEIDSSRWREEGIKEKWISDVEHNPRKCEVCALLGDWSVTTDTKEWFEQHHKAGFKLRIVDNKIFEKEKLQEVKGVKND